MILNNQLKLFVAELYAQKKYDEIAHIVAKLNGFEIPIEITEKYLYLSELKQRKKQERKAFKKPTLDEIKEMIKANNLKNVDAEDFFYFYESKDWKIGVNPMKSVSMTLFRWDKRNKKNNNSPQKYDEQIDLDF